MQKLIFTFIGMLLLSASVVSGQTPEQMMSQQGMGGPAMMNNQSAQPDTPGPGQIQPGYFPMPLYSGMMQPGYTMYPGMGYGTMGPNMMGYGMMPGMGYGMMGNMMSPSMMMPMMRYGGMGPNMMGYGMTGYGMMGNMMSPSMMMPMMGNGMMPGMMMGQLWGQGGSDEFWTKTYDQRKQLHTKMFDYMEAVRTNKDVTEIQKEIQKGITELQKMMFAQ